MTDAIIGMVVEDVRDVVIGIAVPNMEDIVIPTALQNVKDAVAGMAVQDTDAAAAGMTSHSRTQASNVTDPLNRHGTAPRDTRWSQMTAVDRRAGQGSIAALCPRVLVRRFWIQTPAVMALPMLLFCAATRTAPPCCRASLRFRGQRKLWTP